MNKPTKPSETLPSSFGGIKENFSSSKISTGYEPDVPDILGGANLNYLLDTLGKKDTYYGTIVDYINNIPINKTPVVNANNQLIYTQYDIRVYSATETYSINDYVTGIVDGVKHIYKSLQNNNVGQSLTNENYWAKTDIISDVQTIGRNLGEIIPSTIPLTDAGLHLLDGTLLSGSGSYSDFVTYIASLRTNYSNLFTTESAWQNSVSQYGVCGKFVYNSTNNTVRLPKVTGFIEGTDTASNLGNLVEAGLPNITGTLPGEALEGSLSVEWWRQVSGCFYRIIEGNKSGNADGDWDNDNVGFDASRSSSIYGNSNTVQPQSVKVLYYIVVATSTKTDIEVDIDEIATDLNGKMDKDGLNAVSSVKFADGQWVSSSLLAFHVTSNGTYNTSLSSYLPNDNYKYEIYVFCLLQTDSPEFTEIQLNSEILMQSDAYATGNNELKSTTGTVIVDSSRTLTLVTAGQSPDDVKIRLLRYRRIGTNQ